MKRIAVAVLVLTALAGCGSTDKVALKRATTTTKPTTTTSAGQDASAPVTDGSGNTIPEFDPGTEPEITEPEPTTEPETTIPAPEVHKVGDKLATDDGVTIQVFSYTQGVRSTDGYSKPDPGMEYALLDVEVCASPTTEASYNELALSALAADNRAYDSGFATVREPGLGSGDIAAGGGCRRGWTTLDVPIGQRPVKLVWDYGSVHAEWNL